MIYVYKQSLEPIHAWAAIRCGGVNNLDPKIKAKYLVLWNVQVISQNGLWHYVFEFDARDTLLLGPLAQRALGAPEAVQYGCDMNWRQWLGYDWEIIDESVRDEILSPTSPGPVPQACITDLREASLIPGIPAHRDRNAPISSAARALHKSFDVCLGRVPVPSAPALPPA